MDLRELQGAGPRRLHGRRLRSACPRRGAIGRATP